MAGEQQLERVHARIDDLTTVTTDIKISVAKIEKAMELTPRHEEGKCKTLVDHIEAEKRAREKTNHFIVDLSLRLIPLLVSAGIGAFACYLGFGVH